METVGFPGLWGLKLNIDRVAFGVFGINIYWYGIIIAVGFMLVVLMGLRDSRKFGLEPDNIIDLVLFATPVAIVASRLFYVAFSWGNFKDNLLEIFNTRNGGLAIYGAIIGALLVAYIFAKKKKMDAFNLFDFAAPYLPLAQAIGRWGNFVNQEAYGTHTDLPWGMTGSSIVNGPVHPTFLYESLWNIGVFFVLIWYRKNKKLNGEVFFLYMILYGIGRAWIEGLRIDSLMVGSLRISQLLAVLFAVFFGVVFYLRRKKHDKAAFAEMEIGTSKYGEILKKLEEEASIPENTQEADVERKED